MSKLFVILILLAVVARSKFTDTHTVLAEIDQDKFGNVMLSMVSLSMASKAP